MPTRLTRSQASVHVRRQLRFPALFAVAALTACSTVAEQRSRSPSAEEASDHHAPAGSSAVVTLVTNATRDSASGPVADEPAREPASGTGVTVDVDKEFPVVRALYVNRFAAQSARHMRQLIQIADETEINALVIDMKDEFGLNFKTQNPEFARNAGTAGVVSPGVVSRGDSAGSGVVMAAAYRLRGGRRRLWLAVELEVAGHQVAR